MGAVAQPFAWWVFPILSSLVHATSSKGPVLTKPCTGTTPRVFSHPPSLISCGAPCVCVCVRVRVRVCVCVYLLPVSLLESLLL